MSWSAQLANQMPPISFSRVFTESSPASISDKKGTRNHNSVLEFFFFRRDVSELLFWNLYPS